MNSENKNNQVSDKLGLRFLYLVLRFKKITVMVTSSIMLDFVCTKTYVKYFDRKQTLLKDTKENADMDKYFSSCKIIV